MLNLAKKTLYTLILIAIGSVTGVAAESKPNVVFILADDLGWSDTTLFGTTTFYKTPNIERLAQRGMTFTRAYASSPLCSPTRASVLTGLSPARHGITSPNCHLPKVILKATPTSHGPPTQKATFPASVSRLDTTYYTLAEMFKDNGYTTGHFGKWHLGPEPYSPLEHGFDVDVPHHPGPGPAGSYVAPWKFKDFDHDPQIPHEHLEDRMAKEAVAFLEQHADKPFFLNYWMFSVHAPFDAKQTLIDKYQKQVTPSDPQRSPTYAAMIESMDDAVGTLLDTLDRLGIADNTIIVFASDNGGNMYNEVDGTSATSNAPLRGGKATMYEGGVRGPAIVVQPGIVPPGSQSDEIIQSSDFYPTLLEMLSIAPQPKQHFDGVSIVPALRGKSLDREAIFTYFPHSPGVPDWLPPAVSVHNGDWKLIRIFHGGNDGQHRYKLYNLKQDIGEQNDLASEFPERVEQLDALIEQHLVETDAVRPLPNPNFDPSKYDVTKEGKAGLKGGANGPKRSKANPPGKPVAGWRPGGTCTLSNSIDALIVTSTGNDPYFSYVLPKAINETSFELRFTMTSDSSGNAQFYWQEQGLGPFTAERSHVFNVQHDGGQHEYVIRFKTKNPLVAVRLDPSRGPGTLKISDIRLVGKDDTTHYRLKLPTPPAVSTRRERKPNVIVIFTDDHGYADLSCQGVFDDVKTPHLDALAAGGVRMTDGYCTAPQCVPSRGGLISGQYQTKWGLESNPQFQDAKVLKRFAALETIPERLKQAGYVTGMAGKWHLGPNQANAIAVHGFDKVFHKNSNGPGHWNMNLAGEDVAPEPQRGDGYHIDLISEFACTFIDRFRDKPFFFYLACRAPHVPLDAPQKYLDRFPGQMPERRRQALAMLSAVDDGVGQIMATLRKHELDDDTLIFVIGDNGAPLKIHKLDAPGGGPGWDGSLNDPLNGEKGMLTEGGIRVPFVVHWKGTIPGGQVYSHPVISLDVGATACALAGLPDDPMLDGVNLLPYLTGAKKDAPHDVLYWRWLGQSAIRKGKWKYLRSDNREYLFDVENDFEETDNLLESSPELAASLRSDLEAWAATQSPPGIWALKSAAMSNQAAKYFDWYLDGKRDVAAPPINPRQQRKQKTKPKVNP
ncbi:N-acetyl-galactosamine-6-sulfate sulfatase (GALNS) [Rhodopirellula maiorica SM1]|uniref:N-acetyl-galactosamine-6-sulfate sulfatase (GALNS) n=1 Tax=Rhodopirellula maiorica SM1 TaxID=1265738 RepID=M5RGM4_9BACT|nr:sulfatase-like hydrolase/transferase [Rhodopirellula maiorica]EMI18485.1 N-acetyl-galactosamine-6-sulfate sulfatase (GALNS) [Rhodopirellula maiorica SM1]